MADKPNIMVTLRASGINRDGVRVDASIEGPAEAYDQLRKKMESLMYDAQAKPFEEVEAKEQR